MRIKLMMYFIVLVLLPLSTLGILGPFIYAHSIDMETTTHTVQMIDQVSRGIEFHIREMEKLINFLALDTEVQKVLNNEPTSPQSHRDDQNAVLENLVNIRKSHPEIAGILLVGLQDNPLSPDLERITHDSLTQENWYMSAIAHPETVHLFSRPIGRNIRGRSGYSADDIVTIAKAVRIKGRGEIAGIALIDLRVSVIADLFKDTSLGQQGFLFVSDGNGGTVYAPRNPVIFRIPNSAVFDTVHPHLLRLAAGTESLGPSADYQILSQRSEYTGWYTSAVISISETLKEVNNIRIYAMVIAGITLTLAIIAAFFFTASIAQPVIALEKLMKKAEAGDLEVRFASRNNDEISRLGHSFNTMIGEIQNLIAQVYRDQEVQRESELRILQEQIKPHFLYNTLDTIHWMAREHHVDSIVNIVQSLTTLFRIGLNRGREMIPLQLELEHVQSYLSIQKTRYESKFDWTIDIDQELYPFLVLKLILQPLVENAIYHGIKERRGHGSLHIRIFREDKMLVMQVIDDGVGMSVEKRAELNRRLTEGHWKKELAGYGIFNVNERIRLSFGENFGLRFLDGVEIGCVAEIRHPLVEDAV